jgi:methylornithine synthase
MRLLMPDRLIPATLDVEGIKGLKARLEAGANVVTSIIPSVEKLAGVAQSTLDIEQGLRSVPAVEKILREMNLSVASNDDYNTWITLQKKNTVVWLGKGVI